MASGNLVCSLFSIELFTRTIVFLSFSPIIMCGIVDCETVCSGGTCYQMSKACMVQCNRATMMVLLTYRQPPCYCIVDSYYEIRSWRAMCNFILHTRLCVLMALEFFFFKGATH